MESKGAEKQQANIVETQGRLVPEVLQKAAFLVCRRIAMLRYRFHSLFVHSLITVLSLEIAQVSLDTYCKLEYILT